MQFVFKEASVFVDPNLYEEFDLVTSIKNETNEYPKELDLTNFSLEAGKTLLELLTLIKVQKKITSKSRIAKIYKILKKFDMSIVTKILELGNYLMISKVSNFFFYLSCYIYDIFLQVFVTEWGRYNFPKGPYEVDYEEFAESFILRIRKIFGIKNKGSYLSKKEHKAIMNVNIRQVYDNPYVFNFDSSKEEVIWNKNVVNLILNARPTINYEFLFTILINIHPNIHSYFTEKEIKTGIDRKYFLTHNTSISPRLSGDDIAYELSEHGNIHLIIKCIKEGDKRFQPCDIPANLMLSKSYERHGREAVTLILENIQLFPHLSMDSLDPLL